MNATTSMITGILAKSQTLTALSPTPMSLPASLASGPVNVTAIATTASSRTSTSAVAIWAGLSFQIGRPSSTS